MGCWFRQHREMLITGEMYFQLRLAGIDCYMETTFPSDQHKGEEFRVDISVFDKTGSPTAVIEVKREGNRMSSNGRQARAYKDLQTKTGIKPLFLNSMSSVPEVLEEIKLMEGVL